MTQTTGQGDDAMTERPFQNMIGVLRARRRDSVQVRRTLGGR